MVRQAHTYLVGAMSGATVIAIAIGVFVVLVSAQVFRDWPIGALGSSGDSGVSRAHSVAGAGTAASAAAAAAAHAAASDPRVKGGAGTGQPHHRLSQAGAVPGSDGVSGTTPVGSGAPKGRTPQGTGSPAPGSSGAGGGNGSAASSPQAAPASSPAGSSSGASSGGSKGGGSTTAGTPLPSSASGAVTETVNGTVAKVDETALGGTLGKTGVTGVTEGVVNGAAAPESTVGKVVDETVKAVGGLLGGGH